MSTLQAVRDTLTGALGSYLEVGRPDGVFHLALGGPASVQDVWTHPGGWRLVPCDLGTGWRSGQQALRARMLAEGEGRRPGGRAPRGKNQGDFGRVLPTLSAQARAWLAGALRLTDPGHPWLADLA